MDLAECKHLIEHAQWADSLVWKSASRTGAEDAEVNAKLYHLHVVQWAYLRVWRGDLTTPPEPASFATAADLHAWARDSHLEIASYLSALPADVVQRQVLFPWADRLVERFGKARPATWPESVLQVAMHSTYHRGQVARRLRELGAEPPLTDFIAWIWMNRPSPDWTSP